MENKKALLEMKFLDQLFGGIEWCSAYVIVIILCVRLGHIILWMMFKSFFLCGYRAKCIKRYFCAGTEGRKSRCLRRDWNRYEFTMFFGRGILAEVFLKQRQRKHYSAVYYVTHVTQNSRPTHSANSYNKQRLNNPQFDCGTLTNRNF